MNKADILRKTGNILTELQEQFEYLRDHHQDITELELELFMANADFLKDHILILQKLNQSVKHNIVHQPVTESPQNVNPQKQVHVFDLKKEEAKPQLKQEEQKTEVKSQILPQQETKHFEFENKPKEEFIDSKPSQQEYHKPISDDNEEEDLKASFKNEAVETSPKEEPFLVKHPQIHENSPEKIVSEDNFIEENRTKQQTEIVEDQFQITKPEENFKSEGEQEKRPEPEKKPANPTINDLMSKHTKPSSIPDTPIKDLKSAISLNQKLLFIKELFNGYNLAYSEAIELLNRFDSMEVADTFLKNNYAGKNNWQAKQPIVDQLYEILSKKYLK